MSHRKEVADSNPEALLADGLEAALVGVTINQNHPVVAVYDAAKCVQVLVDRDGMTEEEAEEYLEFNTFCAYVGPNGPLFVRMF
jgi:hypothetical protein